MCWWGCFSVVSESSQQSQQWWVDRWPSPYSLYPVLRIQVISLLFFLTLWQYFRSTVLQQQFNKVGKVETGSVALPAIMRSGAGGPESFQMGSMPQAKQHITSGQMHRGHMPPLVKQYDMWCFTKLKCSGCDFCGWECWKYLDRISSLNYP